MLKRLMVSAAMAALLLSMITVSVGAASFERPRHLQAVSCEEIYVVQADDWLSQLADRFYGDVLAYPAIFAATNIAAEGDPIYATLTDPNVIEVGQTLCIPSLVEAQALLAEAAAEPVEEATVVVTAEPDVAPTIVPEPQPTVATYAAPDGKALLIFINETGVDIEFDIGQSTPFFAVVQPDGREVVELNPGQHSYVTKQVGGGLPMLGARLFDASAGDVLQLVCNASFCELTTLD